MTTFTSSSSSSSSFRTSSSSHPDTMSSFSSFTPSLSSFSTSTSPGPTNMTNCSFDDQNLGLPLAVFYSLFFVFGLVGNLFALWVFLFLHSSRNSVRVFLINCAVADLVLLACLPFRVFYHIKGNRWLLGKVACKLVGNVFYMNMYVSILLLGLISLDRYLRLQARGRARRCMRMRLWGRRQPWSWVACGALWSLSLLGLAAMIATPEDDEQSNSQRCFQYKRRANAKGKAYFNAVLVVFFWLVFIMLVVSYAKIASRLLQVSRDKPDLPNAHKYQRTAKKSFFVLFLFTVCFGPYHVFRPIYIISQVSKKPCNENEAQLLDRINEVMLLFSAFNSCLDPIMYFLLSGSVRKAALQALGHRLGNRLGFLNEATSNSSTTEFRRSSVPMALPEPGLTPRTSICALNSALRRTGATTLPPAGQK